MNLQKLFPVMSSKIFRIILTILFCMSAAYSAQCAEENTLENALNEEQIEIPKLDTITKLIVFSDQLSRNRKLDIFMNQLDKQHENQFAFEYLGDVFMVLKPIEKTNEIIQRYQQSESDYVRHEYLELLIASLAKKPEQKYLDERYQIKKLMDSILAHQPPDELLSFTIGYYPDYFMDETSHRVMFKRLEELRVHHPDMFKKIVRDSTFWYHLLGLTTQHHHMDEIELEKIIALTKDFSNFATSDAETKKFIARVFNSAVRMRLERDKAFKLSDSVKKRLQLDQNDEYHMILKDIKKIETAISHK